MKRCSKCKKLKDDSQFGRERRHKNGLRSWCRQCESEYARRYYNRDGGPVKKYYKYDECHRVVGGVKEKRCRRCGKWKPESEYYKRYRNKDGFAVWCKKCADEAVYATRRKKRAAARLRTA